MQKQLYLTYPCWKAYVVLQTQFARVALLGSNLALAVALVLCLAGHAHATTTIFSHATGHAHTTTLAVRQFTNISPDGEWPGG